MPMAKALRDARSAQRPIRIRQILQLRADALLTDDYYKSDLGMARPEGPEDSTSSSRPTRLISTICSA